MPRDAPRDGEKRLVIVENNDKLVDFLITITVMIFWLVIVDSYLQMIHHKMDQMLDCSG